MLVILIKIPSYIIIKVSTSLFGLSSCSKVSGWMNSQLLDCKNTHEIDVPFLQSILSLFDSIQIFTISITFWGWLLLCKYVLTLTENPVKGEIFAYYLLAIALGKTR